MKIYLFSFLLAISIFHSNVHANGNSKLSNCKVKFIKWEGGSPGDKFVITYLSLAVLDFKLNKMRVFYYVAHDPEPMLPSGGEDLEKLIEKLEWKDIPKNRVNDIISLIDKWIKTDPPLGYNKLRTFGAEDGMREALSISWDSRTISTDINYELAIPLNGHDPLSPPAEYDNLIKELTSLSRSGRKLIKENINSNQ